MLSEKRIKAIPAENTILENKGNPEESESVKTAIEITIYPKIAAFSIFESIFG